MLLTYEVALQFSELGWVPAPNALRLPHWSIIYLVTFFSLTLSQELPTALHPFEENLTPPTLLRVLQVEIQDGGAWVKGACLKIRDGECLMGEK